MTLKLEGNLDILKMFLHIENCWILVTTDQCRCCMIISSKMKKYDNSSQGQTSRTYVFQTLLAFTMEHIPTMVHQFMVSSFRDFVRTGAQTDRQTPLKQ